MLTGRRPTLALLLLLATFGAPPGDAASRTRIDGASRLPDADAASEYWDLVARLDSGHRVFMRFLVTNEGPGRRWGVANGHVVTPQGDSLRMDNAKPKGSWELSPDGRRIHIASSILDLRHLPHKLEYDSDRRGVKLHLWFEPDQALALPREAELPGFHVDLLDASARARGTLWYAGLAEPIPVRGELAITHTWTERSEAELAARRIELFALGEDSSLYLSDLTLPDGRRRRWLAALRGGERWLTRDFEIALEGESEGGGYPVPAALRLRGPDLQGFVEIGEPLLRDDPFEALPQPFRWLLSLRLRPRRIWAETPYAIRLRTDPQAPEWTLRGLGFTSLTFAHPLPPALARAEAAAAAAAP